ncbi:hypothetical protein TWF730_003146 [Orbilia blumenaviensis]|uniref:Uncharacterized protein n=1 Tax=Orbilia blumenaviensis TaxID=1796055 RepID=A0AAV9U8W1_9PEZI
MAAENLGPQPGDPLLNLRPDISLLPPQEISNYLKSLLTTSSHETITTHLLSKTSTSTIPPSIFKIWLCISPTPQTVNAALSQTFSQSTRRITIKVLWKLLRSNNLTKWFNTWNGIGGVTGLLEIFNTSSVEEVRLLCRRIGQSTRISDPLEKRVEFTKFYKALLSSSTPNPGKEIDGTGDTHYINPDTRRLEHLYLFIAKSCTAQFIEQQAGKNGDSGAQDYEWVDIRDKLVWKVYRGYLEYRRLQDDLEEVLNAEEWCALYLQLYPSLQTTVPDDGGTACLAFSNETLEEILKQDWESKIRQTHKTKYKKLPGKFVEGVIYPLTRRIRKIRASNDVVKRLLDLSMSFFEEDTKRKNGIRRGVNDLLDVTLVAWKTEPETFEGYLRKLMKIYYSEKSGSHQQGVEWLKEVLANVPVAVRYALLRIYIQEVKELDIDIDDDLKKSGIVVGHQFLSMFPPKTAFTLYNRLETATDGTMTFIKEISSSSIFYLTALDATHSDADIWQIHLLHLTGRQQEADELALQCFAARKALATAGSTPQIRAKRAREAVYYTVASGSPDVYRQGMEWILQRFIRDPFVVFLVFEFYPAESNLLFLGIPGRIYDGYTAQDLTERIAQSDRLLKTVYETAFAAAKEPSFNLKTWKSTLQLIPDIIRQRILGTKKVAKVLGVTVDDEVIYEILWKGMVQNIVEIEKFGVQTGYEALGLGTIYGVFNYEERSGVWLKLEEKSTAGSTYRFFDELARARDEMWREIRRASDNAAFLPSSFPRGLPVQALIGPYTVVNPRLEKSVPYLYSRAVGAVYLDEEVAVGAIPTDEETWAAVGPFVDNFGVALRMLVPEGLSRAEERDRLKMILERLVTPLSERVSGPEAAVFWKHHVLQKMCENSWYRVKHTSLINDVYDFAEWDAWPLPPSKNIEEGETEEWDPHGDFKTPSRELGITYLDLSLNITERNTKGATMHTKLERFTPRLPVQDEIWSDARIARARYNPKMRVGQILSAISYLKQYFDDETALSTGEYTVSLKKAFRPKTSANFAAAINALTTHINDVPPVLLQQLVEVAICAPKDIAPVVQLIKLLAKSDTPVFAAPFAIAVVLEHPEASSWHRQLLQLPYIGILGKADAAECLVKFGRRIIEILEEKDKADADAANVTVEKNTSGGQQQQKQQPYVKITTIKHLANLLTQAAVEPATAVDILESLAGKCKHHDARQAVLESLITILTACVDERLAERTVKALEFIIPIAGDLNSRAPIPEEKWREAEEKGDVGVLNVAIEDLPRQVPLYTVLNKGSVTTESLRWKKLFVKNILVKVVDALKVQTRRYLNIFLLSHGFTKENIEEMGLLVVPGSWQAWNDIAGGRGSEGGLACPREVLEEYAEYMLFRISLPKELVEFGKKLKNMDKQARLKPGVKFWEEQYGVDIPTTGGLSRLRVLSGRKETFERMGVDSAVVREEVKRFLVGGLYLGA